MFALIRLSVRIRWCFILAYLIILCVTLAAPVLPSGSLALGDYPPDPTADIPWLGNKSGVGDIEAAFNHARMQEYAQLSGMISPLPPMDLPSQSAWDAMSDNDKALFLVNSERLARSVQLLHSYESNVVSVAQNYADYLLTNDKWGHYADGKSPTIRLGENTAIANCHDGGLWMENLFASATTASSIPLPVESAIYDWIYEDASSSWGHREMILHFPYLENGGSSDREGFMGIGRASGGPYTIKDFPYPTAEVIVMNAFDPCGNWKYGTEPPPPINRSIFMPIIVYE